MKEKLERRLNIKNESTENVQRLIERELVEERFFVFAIIETSADLTFILKGN